MKNRKILARYGMLLRLIATILVAVLLPVLIVSSILLRDAYRKMEQQYHTQQLQLMSQLDSFFCGQKDLALEAAVRLATEKKITYSFIQSQRYHELEAIRQLQIYQYMVPSSSNIFLYFDGSDFLVGGKYRYTRDIFLTSYCGEDAELRQKLSEALDSTQTHSYFVSSFEREGTGEPWLLLCIPVSFSSHNDAKILYVFSESMLSSALASAYPLGNTDCFITDEEGNLLLSSTDAERSLMQSDEFNRCLENTENTSATVEWKDKQYAVFKIYDSSQKIYFFTAVDGTGSLSPVSEFYKTFQTTFSMLIILCLLLFCAVIYINYRPIYTVTRQMLRKGYYDDSAPDELTAIHRELDKRGSENEAMMEQIAEQQITLTDYLLKSVLNNEEIQPQVLSAAGIDLNGCCCVMVTDFVLDNVTEQRISETVWRECGCRVTIFQPQEEQQLLFLCTLPKSDKEIQKRLAEKIRRAAEAPGCRLGVGQLLEDSRNIRISYTQALIALGQCPEEETLFYEEIVDTFNSFNSYPSDEVLRFLQEVKTGNEEAALREFDSILALVQKNCSSIIIEQYVCYDIINNFIKTVLKMEVPLTKEETTALLQFKGIQNIAQTMRAPIKRVCAEVQSKKDAVTRSLYEKIIAYLENHFDNPDLSLPMVADEFRISIYKLGSIFSEYADVGFRETITRLRLERSREMLSDPKLSVKEIAFRSGFRDVSYFIKLFKNAYDITPAVYRSGEVADEQTFV